LSALVEQGHNVSVVVQCQNCQARFRVADEKVTDRGVRVRCTGCRTVFLVRKDGTQAPLQQQAPTGETTMGMAAVPAPAAPPKPPQAPRAAAPAAPRPQAQPSARPSAPPPAARTSNPPALNGASKRPPADDPFGMAELTGDPAPPKPRPTPAPRTAAPPSKPAPPAAPPRQQPPGLRARPKAELPPDLDIDIDAPPRPVVPPQPQQTDTATLAIGKMARTRAYADEPQAPSIAQGTQAPQAASQPPPPPPLWDDDEPSPTDGVVQANGAAAAEDAEEGSEPAPRPKSGLRDDPFAGIELEPGSTESMPLRASDPSLAKITRAQLEGAKSRPPAEAAEATAAAPEPHPPARTTRRQIVSSALTGLVGAALALLLAAGPSAFTDGGLRALMGGGELVAIQEAAGLYDTAAGRPVYFVRGRIENRGKRVSGPVRVVATLVSDAGASARTESLAGVELGPEEVHGLRSSADADKLMKTLAQKSERRLPPGGSLPFLAVFIEPPPDLASHRIQLRLESAETAAAR
jgi:predicted Zn finger-like uncharacterized protein